MNGNAPTLAEVPRQKLIEMMEAQKRLARTLVSLAPTLPPQMLVLVQKSPSPETELEAVTVFGPFNSDEEKRVAMEQVGQRFDRLQQIPLAIAFMSAAWRARNPRPGVRPEDCKNREEVILVACEKAGDRNALIADAPLTRLREGMPAIGSFGEIREGRFVLLDHFWRGFFGERLKAWAERN